MYSFDLSQNYHHLKYQSTIPTLTQQIQQLLQTHHSQQDKVYRNQIIQSLQILTQNSYLKEAQLMNSQIKLQQVNQTLAINQQLDLRKVQLLQKIQQLQAQKSKLNLQRKNYLNLCEAQTNRYALENKQNKIIKERTIELLTNVQSTHNSINKLKQTLSRLQQTVFTKEQEIKQNMNEIQQLTQKNNSFKKQKQELQKKTKQCEQPQQSLKQNKINIVNRQNMKKTIQDTLQDSKLLKQRIIQMKKQLQDKKNQQQYFLQRMQMQQNNIKQLQQKQQILTNSIDHRRNQLAEYISFNNSLLLQIQQQKQNVENQYEKKQFSEKMLREVLETNRMMMKAIEDSCKQDKYIYQCLSKKYEGLNELRQGRQKLEYRSNIKTTPNHSKTISIVDKFNLKQNQQPIVSYSKLTEQIQKHLQKCRNPLQDHNL